MSLLTGSRSGVQHDLAVGVVHPVLRGFGLGARGHGQGAPVAPGRAGVEAERRVGQLDLGAAVFEEPLLLRSVGARLAVFFGGFVSVIVFRVLQFA